MYVLLCCNVVTVMEMCALVRSLVGSLVGWLDTRGWLELLLIFFQNFFRKWREMYSGIQSSRRILPNVPGGFYLQPRRCVQSIVPQERVKFLVVLLNVSHNTESITCI
jgi:hypothetical protein